MSAGPDPVARWVATDCGDVVWVNFDDGAALYHRPSGKTHFLNASSVALLQRLAAGPVDAAEAAGSVLAESGEGALPEFLVQVSATLERFEQVGLARRLVP